MAWLKLFRWKNLLIIFLTQLLAWGCVMVPMQQIASGPMLLHTVHFLCLSLSTVLIAAAGYVINDYFDIRIDVLNRPEKMVLEKRIPRRMAIILHSVLNAVALLLAAVVALRAGHPEWLLMQLFCSLMLWFYSTRFKRQFITGNVVVALLTAFTIVVLMLYEPAMHPFVPRSYFLKAPGGLVPNPVWVLGVYTYFAFMLTWMREIVKDMEDFKGDAAEGCQTMPIRLGLKRSVAFTRLLGMLAVLPLLIAGYKLIMAGWMPLGAYTLAALAAPLLVWMLFLGRRATTAHYHDASRLLKLIMLLGIGSLIIYFNQAHG